MAQVGTVVLLSLLVLTKSQNATEPQADTTYSGYLIDDYCFGLVRAGGRAVDGSNPIKDPSKHTIHCLATPAVCRPGYYLASKNNVTGNYDVKFRLDSVGNDRARELLEIYRQQQDAHPRYRQGFFTVTATGVADGVDGFLRYAQLQECEPRDSPQCDSICNSTGNGCNITGRSDLDLQLEAPALLWAHVLCMLLGWGCLLPAGVLWARNLRKSQKKSCGSPIWFHGHWILQSFGWLFQLIGFICIFLLKGVAFRAPHEILGLIVVVIGSLQPVNAQLRRLSCVGHPPEDGEEKKTGRFLWEILHKGAGYVAVVAGAVNIVLGILYAQTIGFSGALIMISVVFAALSLGSMTIFTVYTEVRRCFESGTDAERAGVCSKQDV